MQAPPTRLLLAYRLLGWKLGPRYRGWVHQDITGPGWVVRQGLPFLVVMAAMVAAVVASTGAAAGRIVTPVLLVVVVLLLLRRGLAARALRGQGLLADGEVDPAASAWYDDDEVRTRRSRNGAVATVVLVVAALAVLAS